ncbi:MAG: hypothetical protein COA78_09590 [Blastopirellula sp.]|nr:MAG: hypothetical protein COA78_09590 [Blastopirellula sp.]
MRYLEDKVYALQDVVDQKDAQINSSQKENNSLRKRLGLPADFSHINNSSTELNRLHRSDTPNLSKPYSSDPPALSIELGTPRESSSNLETSDSVISEVNLPLSTASEESPPDAPSVATIPEETKSITDFRIDSIKLSPRLTGGYDFDDTPGDEGVMVVLEPRNKLGQYISKAAPISVVVLDPAYQGDAAYVARWDFETIETAKYLKESLFGRGIHLKLPWPNGLPKHEELLLFVRYKTIDGTQLQEKKNILISLPAELSARWTPNIDTQNQAIADSTPITSGNSVESPTPAAVSPAVTQPAPSRSVETIGSRPVWSPLR